MEELELNKQAALPEDCEFVELKMHFSCWPSSKQQFNICGGFHQGSDDL